MKRALKRFFWWSLAVVGGTLLLTLASLPWWVRFIPVPDIELDLTPNLTPEAAAFVTNTTVTAHVDLARSRRGGVLATVKGRLLDWPYTFVADLDYSLLLLKADVGFEFGFDAAPWVVCGSASATPRRWKATVVLPETDFTEQDPLLASLLARVPRKGISELAFAARLKFEVNAERTAALPVPVWTAKGRLAEGSFSCLSGLTPIQVGGANASFGAEGIADRVMILPTMLRLDSVDCAGFELTDLYGAVRKTERGFMISEAGAHVCGGEVKLYSLFLDPESLTAGFTLFLDDIDANLAIRQLKDFKGEASGRLHGKLPLFLKNGKELRLRNAYLYSTPGETGHLRLTDATPVLDNLALGGVDEATRDNLAKALTNLLYTVLKLDLKRENDGSLALGLKVEGSASRGRTTVPVSFQVTFHGDLEQLINTGLRAVTTNH